MVRTFFMTTHMLNIVLHYNAKAWYNAYTNFIMHQSKKCIHNGREVSGMTDNELVIRSQNGDITAFEQLVEGYSEKIINTAYSIVKNREDAYDIAQEVLLKAYKGLKNFDGRSSFSTWIYRITKNTCLDEIRKKNKQRMTTVSIAHEDDGEVVEIQIADPDPGPEDILYRKELGQQINKLIDELPEDYRMVVTMREIQDLDYQRIADILGCSLGTVKSRLSRARKIIKEKILANPELF